MSLRGTAHVSNTDLRRHRSKLFLKQTLSLSSPARDAGYHWSVRWGLRGVLDNQLHGTGVKSVVDEAVVVPAVLNRYGAELETEPVRVQGPPLRVVPLGDLVIVSQQSQPIVGVGGALATVAALTHPLYEVDVGGAGHAPTRHRDVTPGPGHYPGVVQGA